MNQPGGKASSKGEGGLHQVGLPGTQRVDWGTSKIIMVIIIIIMMGNIGQDDMHPICHKHHCIFVQWVTGSRPIA